MREIAIGSTLLSFGKSSVSLVQLVKEKLFLLLATSLQGPNNYSLLLASNERSAYLIECVLRRTATLYVHA